MPARVVVLSSSALRVAVEYEECVYMKTRCVLQEDPSENDEVCKSTFFPMRNSHFLIVVVVATTTVNSLKYYIP